MEGDAGPGQSPGLPGQSHMKDAGRLWLARAIFLEPNSTKSPEMRPC